MDKKNVVVVRFEEPSKAYEALSVLKQLDSQDRIGLESAAVVTRKESGELQVADRSDNVGPVGTVSGSLIGMLIGVLGGPVGVLLGWGGGALIGGAVDITRADDSDEALTVLGQAIPPESTALIASVDEPVVEIIDAEMEMLGGSVSRRSVEEVLAELGAADEAAGTAAREARRVVREKRKAEFKEGVEEHTAKLTEKLHVS